MAPAVKGWTACRFHRAHGGALTGKQPGNINTTLIALGQTLLQPNSLQIERLFPLFGSL